MTLTVTQVNEYIKMVLDGDELLGNLLIKGEISNFTNHRTGHFYFSLKDEGGIIRAVMFRSYAQTLPFIPENGMKVIVHGRVSSFVRDGQYQVYVDDIQPDGVGALYIAYEQLKNKLEAQGLFDSARKKAIPRIPKRIGVVTSPTGAAIRDMLNILSRRFLYTEVVLYPSLVQGPGAATQIAEGVEYFNKNGSVDVIIVGRGGGSIEDLWAFNDERLAICIAASKIPIISAVGHETDFTICDFVADMRAPTPSAAAELAVPELEDIKRRLENINVRNRGTLENQIAKLRNRISSIENSGVLSAPERLLDQKRMNVMYCTEKMNNIVSQKLFGEKVRLSAVSAKLAALNPLDIIARGYSVITSDEGRIVSSVLDISKDDLVNIRFADGYAEARIGEITKTEMKTDG